MQERSGRGRKNSVLVVAVRYQARRGMHWGGEAVVVRLGSDRIGGGVCGGGDRHRSSSSPTPLSSSTSQRLFVAFLVRFAGGGEGAGEVSCGDGGGGSAGGGSGRI